MTRPARSSGWPLLVRMHPADNVAVVANEGGLAAGTVLQSEAPGLTLRERVPQAHKVALVDIPEAVELLRERESEPMVAEYIAFITASTRGICHGSGRATRGTVARAAKGEGILEGHG